MSDRRNGRDSSDPPPSRNALFDFLIRETTVISVILINSVGMFLNAFPGIHAAVPDPLFWLDYACIVYFIAEAGLKIDAWNGFREYWSVGWNRFDFVIVAVGLPVLAAPFVSGNLDVWAGVLVLRLGRLARFARLLRFIPEARRIWADIVRALRVSVGIFVALFLLNVVLGMGASILFGGIPEAESYFGNPLRSMYSLFKVFTVEGWYEIPERLAAAGVAAGTLVWLKVYFVVAVLSGGLLGLSIANAVFVDAMVADNTDKVERMMLELHDEVRALRREIGEAGNSTPE